MKKGLTVEDKILASFAVAVAVVFAFAGAMWKISDNAHSALSSLTHSNAVLYTVASAEAELFRIESSVRGYLVSGNRARLAERDEAIASLQAMLARLAELRGDNARLAERRDRLRAAINARLAIHAQTVALRDSGGLEAARAYIASTPQREADQQSALEILREMKADERRLAQERDTEQRRLREVELIASTITALLFAALLAAAYLLIRRQTAQLRASRERADEVALARKALLDAADVSIISTDTEGVIQSFNRAAERMLAYEAAELLGSQTPAIIHDSDEIRARARQLSEELEAPIAPGFEVFVAKARRNQPDAHEWTYVRKDGGRLPVLLSVSPLRDGSGRLTGFLGVATDISQRKEAEKAIARERDRLDLALTAANMAMWDADLRSGQVSLDERWASMLGEAPAASVTTVAELVKLAPAGDQDRLMAAAADVVTGRTPAYLVEYQVRAADGGWRWIQSHGKVVERDAEGRALRVMGINSDITERKGMELQLAAKEAQLRLITENVPARIGYHDEREICRFANTGYAGLSGRSVPEILGQSLQSIVGAEDYRDIEPYIRKAQQGEQVHHEITNRDPAGAERTLLASLVPDRSEGGGIAGFYVMILDITERARAERALAAAKDAAEAANRAKDSFLAVMSHEIRTPLNGMLGMLELLGLSRLDGEQRQALEAARDSGSSLVRIIDDVLDHAKIEAGKLQLRPEPTSIAGLMRRVANTYSALASSKGLALRQVADPNISPSLFGDPLRLMQIVGNFVSNAVKFTAEGYVEIRAELVERKDRLETVRLSVRDTGIGIASEAQARLFRPFEQAGADTSRLYGGTGLGLAISRRLAEMMDGTIAVESDPGKGTTMSLTLTLPVVDAMQREDSRSALAAATPAAAPGQLAELLVVDDHPINRQLLERQLKMLGLRAQSAADGEEALALWKRQAFPTVITDCHMPGLDGYALSRAVRAMEAKEGRPRTPIIAWTANVLADTTARCRAAGMDDILTKPASLAALREVLSKWLPAGAVGPLPTGQDAMGGAQSEPIDITQLEQIAASAEERAVILQDYMAQMRIDLADLVTAMKSTDLQASTRIAHRMKGASRTVGAHELALACEELEDAARRSNAHAAAAAHAAVDRAVNRIDAYVRAAAITEEKQ